MTSYDSLLERIAIVRRRWRFQAAVKWIALFIIGGAALLTFCIWGASLFGFKPGAVWLMRILSLGALLLLAWRFLYRPLCVRINDVQTAQFIEENYPHLEDRLVSAVECGCKDQQSQNLIDLLIKDALEKTGRLDFSIFIKTKRIAAFSLIGLAACVSFMALLNWGPSFFSFGFERLYFSWTESAQDFSVSIKISPGNVEIVKGSDQQIQAQLIGFDSKDVRLFLKSQSSDVWNSSAMEPDHQENAFRRLLIDIQLPLQYYVESMGVRSKTFSLKVLDLARAEKIDITYNFPAYTRMASQTVANEGDISALKGTKVDLKIHLNRTAPAARLLFNDQSTMDLSATGAQDFMGTFSLQKSGSYVVQIAGEHGKRYAGSSEYRIEALEDSAPKVVITKPKRDIRATSLEEVFSESKAEDDIGVSRLEMHYSVNGGPDKAIRLDRGKAETPSVIGTHAFFLEEFGLQPGDMVSYYAKAWDNNNVTGPGSASSDIYFIQVRRFDQKYTQSQQAAQQQQGESQGERQEDLSRQQKEIISATFNLMRDQKKMDSKEYLEHLKNLALVQGKLQTQAQGLIDRLQRRGAEQLDSNFKKLSEYLKNSAAEMGKASANLGAEKPNEAMPNEQKALQQAMRAESLFRDIQVSFMNQQGNGQSGQDSSAAEDLADLFELEMNKLKNQYETVQKGEQQQRDQKIDEALQRLKELAQRQQQLNERNRQMAQRGGSPQNSSGNGRSQQQLMEQAEQIQRQLQRLSRERSSPELNEISNQLQKAIEEMKKSQNKAQRGDQAEATAQSIRALQQLDQAARQLERSQESAIKRGMDQAVDESRKLVNDQARIQEELDKLSKSKSQSAASNLVDRKQNLAEKLNNLEGQIQNLSQQARKTQKDAGEKLSEAAESLRDQRLRERILSGNAFIQNGFFENQKEREGSIRRGLENLNRQLESARNSLGANPEQKLEDAANKARQLAEGLESLQQRLESMQPGQQRNQQGQRSRQSRQSQQSPQGQQSPQSPQRGAANAETNIRDLSGNASMPPTGGIRQLRSELGQRIADAQELRGLLDRNARPMGNLEKVVESLQRAQGNSNYSDPTLIEQLKKAIENSRKVESDLMRDLDRLNQADKYFLAEDNEAPADYKKLVEEYYKSIAKSR